MFVESENVSLIGGLCLQMGANVLVEFENVFFSWGHFFIIGGKCVNGI